jgi:glycosyltransferase involved in cell wall biosynthesis
MKITHINYSKSGGSGEVARLLSEEQNKLLGYESELVFKIDSQLREKPFQDLSTVIRSTIDNYYIKTSNAEQFLSLSRNNTDKRVRGKLLKTESLIHLHWINGILDYNFINFLSKKQRITWTLHDMEFMTGGCHYSMGCTKFKDGCRECPIVKDVFKSFVSKNYNDKFKNYNWNKVNFVAPSEWIIKKFHDNENLKNHNIHLIKNPIDQIFFQSHNSQAARQKIDLPHNAFVVGFISAWIENPQKGLYELIKILNKIASLSDRKIVLVTVGKSKLNNLQNMNFSVKHLGIIHNKIELAEIYSTFNINVSLSKAESFGLTVAETMALGISSLVLASSAASELIVNNTSGWICKSTEEASNLLQLLIDGNSKKLDSNFMKNYAMSNFHPSGIIEKYEKVYKII